MRGVIAALVALAALAVAAAAPARATGVQHVTLHRRLGRRCDSRRLQRESRSSSRASTSTSKSRRAAASRAKAARSTACAHRARVQLIQSLGSKIGPNVVVAVGYNDFEDQYAGNIEDAINAMTAAGVKQIFWLTLRAARHPYLSMNDDIAQAAAKHPQVTVVDWNVYSRSHPDWFQTDGLHLLGPGAEAMATLIHKSLLTAGVAAKPAAHHDDSPAGRAPRQGVPARSSPRPQGVTPVPLVAARARAARHPPRGERRRDRHAARASPAATRSTCASATRSGRSRPAG